MKINLLSGNAILNAKQEARLIQSCNVEEISANVLKLDALNISEIPFTCLPLFIVLRWHHKN